MIDVSEFQGHPDWRKAHDVGGLEHAAIKFAEWVPGRSFRIDPCAIWNAEHARAAGVTIFFYFFGHPTHSPLQEAREFCRFAAPFVKSGDLPPALDLEVVEGHSWEQLNEWRSTFQHVVDQEFGVPSIFYSYRAFIDRMRLDPQRPIWGAATGYAHVPDRRWSIWQYSHNGTFPGVRGKVDLDRILHDIAPVQ